MKNYIIGIDIGGTNTDGVIIDNEKNILTFCKTTTTSPLDLGVKEVLKTLCTQANIAPQQIKRINIGTTQATNALLENKGLLNVGVLRLATDCSHALPPFCRWPNHLQSLSAGYAIVSGGYECDGSPINPINKLEIEQALKTLQNNGIQALAIVGIFSPLNGSQEQEVELICKKNLGHDFPISMSHTIGGINFLQRENATIINSALKKCITDGFKSLQTIVQQLDFECPLYITQNNGTIISLQDAINYPVLTISSGPTNSFNGALHLTKLQDAIIVDIGGTSTDIGIALQGFARRSLCASHIADIPLNFTMPDVISIAIGGGSYIQKIDNNLMVGPQSCSKNLVKESLIFGGNRMTLTDIAVKKRFITIPHATTPVNNISDELASEVMTYVEKTILTLCRQIAGKHKNLPIVFIGGGAMLFANSPLAKQIIIPKLAPLANALGAALAQVSGSIDTVVELRNHTKTIKQLAAQAKQRAVQAGAHPQTVHMVEQQMIPYSYTTNNLTRIKITMTGDLE